MTNSISVKKMIALILNEGVCGEDAFFPCWKCPLHLQCASPLGGTTSLQNRQMLAYKFLLIALKKEDIPTEVEAVMFELLL